MENQKILWVVFSITLFLLVVVVVGFVWFLPPEDGDPASAFANANVISETRPERYDPIEWMRETSEVPGLTEDDGSTEGDLLLVIGATDDSSGSEPVTDSSRGQAVRDTASSGSDSGGTTIRVAAPSVPVAAESDPPEGQTRQTPRVAPVRARPEPTHERITLFWIQAGSFLKRSSAEAANASLADAGATGRITSIDVGSDTYYRVRLGPYESKREAVKLLDWLKELDSFASSYISEVYTSRRVN